MSLRDRDGDAIPIVELSSDRETWIAAGKVLVVRNELADLVDELKTIDTLAKRCPAIAEVGEWRESTAARLAQLGEELIRISRSYEDNKRC